MNNNKFISQWQVEHEKGLLKYLIKYIIPIVIISILSMLLFSYKNGSFNIDNIYNLLKYNLMFIVMYTILVIYNWISSEKEYKRLLKNHNETDQNF